MEVPLVLPPGLNGDDTTLAAQGRWADANHVRFVQGRPQQIGPWNLAVASGAVGMRSMFVWCMITITTNGTGAGYIQATLPVAARNAGGANGYQVLNGAEVAVTGKSVRPLVSNNAATCLISSYDGSYPAANGYVIVVSGSYEAA